MAFIASKICASVAALATAIALTPGIAHADTLSDSYQRDEFGGYPAKLADEYGNPNQGVGPQMHTFPAAALFSRIHPGSAPQGANNFQCRPRVKNALPVILIPGTNEDAYATWSYYAPMLTKAGLCVYTFNYNLGPGLLDALTGNENNLNESLPFNGDIVASAKFLGKYVDIVLQRTGAPKVDFVGHSQGGGILPNTYIKWYGGDKKVRHSIGLVASNHGSTLYGSVRALERLNLGDDARDALSERNLAADAQQTYGSEDVAKLEEGGITMPGVHYTVITTYFDDVVTPYTHDLIYEPGVTNIVIQNLCRLDFTDHFGMTYDPVTYQVVEKMLTHRNYNRVKCTFVPPVFQ